MPPVKVRMREVLVCGNVMLVERFVMRVDECEVGQSLKPIDVPVSNDLHLWLTWYGIQVLVKDTSFVYIRSMAINQSLWVKAPCQLELGRRCETVLILYQYNTVFIKC
jgi:hypothetical protein